MPTSWCVSRPVWSLPNKPDLVRELLKDGGCAVYALHNMKPGGELRMALTTPTPGPRRANGVFLRIRPGTREATIVRPMNAKAGEKHTKVEKIRQVENLDIIRTWRKQTRPRGIPAPQQEPGRKHAILSEAFQDDPALS